MSRTLAAGIWLAGLTGIACTDDTGTQDSSVPLLGPVLSHAAPDGPFVTGDGVALTVTATDVDGVDAVDLVYRTEDGDYWETLAMVPETGSDDWTADVPGSDVEDPGLDYYFRASDALGVTSFLPLDNADSPYSLDVTDKGAPLPFTEDFEGSTAGYGPLYSLGWSSVADGFAGYPFEISEAQAQDGVAGVLHPRGFEGISLLDDWLLAPPLDFSGVEQIQLTWWEQGRSTDGADHSLWIGTVDRDPRNGTHTQVAVLPPPSEDGWQRSQVIDLTEWSGEPVVHLAWHYVGAYVDDWYIDAVTVRELTCDPVITAAWDASPVSPGDSPALAIDVVNGLDVACAGPLEATISFPDSGASAAGPASLGELEGDGAVADSVAVDVDLDWPDNSYLPVVVTVSDGVDTWTLEQDLVVGETSELRLDLDVTTEGVVQILVGVGDPDAPAWTASLGADALAVGQHSFAMDITDQHALLPPAAGEDRWFVSIDATGSGQVALFEMDHDGWTYESLARESWFGTDPITAWLPEPPDPTVTATITSPSTVEPGDVVVLDLNLRNDGADTSGPVTIELLSSDGDVTLLAAGPDPLTFGSWGAGSTVSLQTPLRFSVSDDHVDSTPVELQVLLDDGVETWELPVAVDVPWVVVKATAVTIDDSTGGNNDGLLDAGESAVLEVELTNVGDLDAAGIVDAVATLESSSTATAVLDVSESTLSTLNAGSSRTAEFEVTVDAGSAGGEVLDLRVDSTDDDNTYTTPLSITLGEPPWLSVSSVDDDRGDAHGFTFDLLNVLYRANGDQLELMFVAAEPFDAASTFVELWGIATSGDYSYYRMAMQSGKATLQGYDSGFIDLGEPSVEYPSSTELKISWPLSDMDPDVDNLRVGFGAGWCAVDTESFCDHFPDGWGYYYHSTYTDSRFFTLTW